MKKHNHIVGLNDFGLPQLEFAYQLAAKARVVEIDLGFGSEIDVILYDNLWTKISISSPQQEVEEALEAYYA